MFVEFSSKYRQIFVKYSLKDYGVYPTFGGEPYNDSFKLFQNQKKLEDLEELLKKPQES